jgi:protein maelstrom
VLLLYRDYVHAVLLWTEQEPTWVVTIIFAALFTLVSLPLAWGYIVINMAAG